VIEDLARLAVELRDTPPEALPEIIGGLEALRAQAWARMMTPSVTDAANGQRPRVEPEQWITPSQAAVIANVPVDRIYTWAQGQRWAARPTRRCLRISETGFRRWLASR